MFLNIFEFYIYQLLKIKGKKKLRIINKINKGHTSIPSHLFFGISQREETPKIMQKTNKTPVVLSAAKPQR
jgi:hypothetical protein